MNQRGRGRHESSDGSCGHRLHRLYRLSAVQRRELSAGQESLQRQVREIAGRKVVKAVSAQRQGRYTPLLQNPDGFRRPYRSQSIRGHCTKSKTTFK